MVVNRVLLCRNCGERIFWNTRWKQWTHRLNGQVNCRPYSSVSAEPTEFREMTGERF
jgi:hypothetical protein